MMFSRRALGGRASRAMCLRWHSSSSLSSSRSQVMDYRERHLNPAMLQFYKEPLMLVNGSMQYLFDEKGKKYLDGFSMIATTGCGHQHPHIIEKVVQQVEKLSFVPTSYLNDQVALFAEELSNRLPDPLNVCYFVNSGSEATDLAVMMARAYTANYDVISVRSGYHGLSQGAMAITGNSAWRQPVPPVGGCHQALNPDRYRGVYDYANKNAGEMYAADIQNCIQGSTSGSVAGFICETVQGVGGAIEVPDNYLPNAYKYIKSANGVNISDEVQTGFGRLGSHFWGFETQQVVPDIVTMAKGIGNGFPLACVVTTKEIAKSISGKIHFNTYGGNPVSCAAGRAVLEVLEKDKIQENSERMGSLLRKGLDKLMTKYEIIGDVRGKGLIQGVELVKDRGTKEPDVASATDIMETCKDLGLLIGKGGLFGNVLRITPVMCLNKEDVDFLLDILEEAILKSKT